MPRRFVVEQSDEDHSIYVVELEPGQLHPHAIDFPTEVAALEHGVACLESRRDHVRHALKTARAKLRRARRQSVIS